MKAFLSFLFCFFGAIAATATPGVFEREVVLGSHQPLSGPASEFAVISRSAEAYFQYINDQGGVHGRLIHYHYLDDAFQPSQTRNVVRQLVLRDQVFLMFNGLGTSTHAAVSPWLQDLKVPDFFVASGSEQWTKPTKETVFGFYPTPQVEGRVLGKYLAETHPREQIVVWHQDEPDAISTFRHLTNTLAQQNRVVRAIKHPTFGWDVQKAVEEIQKRAPQVLVVLTVPQVAVAFLQQAYEQGLQTKIYLGHALADSRLPEWVGKNASEGVSVVAAYPLASQTEDLGIRLHQAILSEYAPQLTMNRWTIYGHAVAEAMAEILYRSGRDLTRHQVVSTAEQVTQWKGVLTPPIDLSPQNHQAVNALRIAQVNQGKFTFISDWIPAYGN